MAEETGKRQYLLLVLTSLIIIFAVILGMSQTVYNPFQDPDVEPIETGNVTYEGNATFILPSGNLTIRCEIADNATERAIGLMYREYLPEDAGMLFVFDYEVQPSFWMKNTLIPLDIIFINSTGHVVNYAEADPEPGVHDNLLERYISNGPVLWVLEVNQGTCSENGIGPGTYVELEY